MKSEGENVQELDRLFIKSCMDKMDKDVATRFVFSAMSLSKVKIDEAFALACREMSIREENKKAAGLGETTDAVDSIISPEFLKLIDDVLLTQTKKDK